MHLKRCSMLEFAHHIEGRRIVCYGVGYEFEQIIRAYHDYEWIDRIGYLLDNSSNKKGKSVQVGKKEFSIITLDELKDLPPSEIVILPTCAAFAEIIEELNGYSWLDDVDCYVFHFMFSMSNGKIDIRQTEESLIPAKIHYCWFGGKSLPEKYIEYIESWKRFCPEYEIIEWNENNLDISETEYTREAYEAGKYGFVPDYFRLKIIYEHGGIYLDTDVEILKNLDDLRYNEAFCAMEFPGIMAFGLGFGAVAHNEIIRSLMDYYETTHFLNPDGSCNMIPSPSIQSRSLFDMGVKCSADFQCFKGMAVYPVDVFSPKNPYTGELRISDNTYAIHHFDGTWIADAERNTAQRKLERAAKLLPLFEQD